MFVKIPVKAIKNYTKSELMVYGFFATNNLEEFKISNLAIKEMLGVSETTVSRSISKFVKQGLMERKQEYVAGEGHPSTNRVLTVKPEMRMEEGEEFIMVNPEWLTELHLTVTQAMILGFLYWQYDESLTKSYEKQTAKSWAEFFNCTTQVFYAATKVLKAFGFIDYKITRDEVAPMRNISGFGCYNIYFKPSTFDVWKEAKDGGTILGKDLEEFVQGKDSSVVTKYKEAFLKKCEKMAVVHKAVQRVVDMIAKVEEPDHKQGLIYGMDRWDLKALIGGDISFGRGNKVFLDGEELTYEKIWELVTGHSLASYM